MKLCWPYPTWPTWLTFARVLGYTGVRHVPTGSALTVGVWSHIVATYDGTTMALYVNGVLVGSMPSAANEAGTSTLELGKFMFIYGITNYPGFFYGVARCRQRFTTMR